MIFQISQLADIIDGDRGKNYPKQNEFSHEGYCLFLNAGNVTPTGFSFEENLFVTQEKDNVLRKGKLQRGDIVYTTRGTVGNAALYSTTVPFENIRINSGMVILRCHEDIVDRRYLYQILKSEYFRPYFKKYCTGSAQPQLPIMNFSKIELDLPPIETQHRIADILSAYDDLIENNRKQIKLLEEAAQRLYKEWFVDLRFPGHEHTRIVDGVPEGWRLTTLDQICSVRKETLIPEKIDIGTPYIGLEHMPKKDICLSEWGDSSEVSSNKFKYYEDDLLFGKIRPYFHKMGFALNSGVVSTDAIVLKSVDGLWSLLLMTVSSSEFVSYTYQNCKEGAKMPRADWIQMKSYPVMIANFVIQSAFEDQIFMITRKIKTLALQANELSEARNRLLPKLINGEV